MGTKDDGTDSMARQVAPQSHWSEMRALLLVASTTKQIQTDVPFLHVIQTGLCDIILISYLSTLSPLSTTIFNPCPATPRYMRLQADFKPNNMPLKMDNMVCARRLISQI